MKKIILSALLASTVAMTAFAGDSPTNGKIVETLLTDVETLLIDAAKVRLSMFAPAVNLYLPASTNGTLVTALQQVAPSADVTEISTKGEANTAIDAVKLVFPARTLLFCASKRADINNKKHKFSVFCGPSLQNVVRLFQ